MNIIDWDHVEWAASAEKTRDIQPRDFEDYKRMACVAMSLRAEITQLRAELAEIRASEHGLFGRLETCRQDEAALKAELEQERELADRLALKLEAYIYMTGNTIGTGAMQEYNNRRNK